MKNNRHLFRTIPLGALLLIAFVVLTAVNYPYRAKLIKHHFQNNHTIEHLDFAPITGTEQLALADANKSAYWIQDAGGAFANPLMVNPMVNIQDIYNYYNNNDENGKYGGIRFYPAFENNTIFLIMCLAEGAEGELSKTAEVKYVKLDKGLLNSEGSVPAASNEITAIEAKGLHARYMNEVFLYKNKQDTLNTEDTLRYSRYFAWADFVMLTDQNLKGAKKVDYLFQIDIGYVTAQMASRIYNRAKIVYSMKQNQGFTAMIHVKDKSGNSLLDPFSRYNSSDPAEKNNYVGRTMEVGSPCPPRCGINY